MRMKPVSYFHSLSTFAKIKPDFFFFNEEKLSVILVLPEGTSLQVLRAAG